MLQEGTQESREGWQDSHGPTEVCQGTGWPPLLLTKATARWRGFLIGLPLTAGGCCSWDSQSPACPGRTSSSQALPFPANFRSLPLCLRNTVKGARQEPYALTTVSP